MWSSEAKMGVYWSLMRWITFKRDSSVNFIDSFGPKRNSLKWGLSEAIWPKVGG